MEKIRIDLQDLCKVSKYKWYRVPQNKTKQKWVIRGGNTFPVLLHRFILELKSTDKRVVDHINNNPLDNRKSNLRICTNKENQMNRSKSLNRTSIYKGVCWHKKANKWCAYIKINKKLRHLGYYEVEKEAAIGYNIAAKILFKEYAKLNEV